MHLLRTPATTAHPAAAAMARQFQAAAEADPPCYCPTRLLASFALLMAGHGLCVNTEMMLGDRSYAHRQLERARSLDDAELAAVAARLVAYFDDQRQGGRPVAGTA